MPYFSYMSYVRFTLLTLTMFLVSCQPSLYVSIENHTGGDARIDIFFDAANDFWKVKGPDVKNIELTNAVINSAVEYTFGSGSWTDEKLFELTKGINSMLITTGGGVSKLDSDTALIDFFENRITGKDRNGIRIVIR